MQPQQILFVIPVFNDWASLATLIEYLDLALITHGFTGMILAVDDGSTIDAEPLASGLASLQAINKVHILRLKRNLGHQRAITIGLAYGEANYKADMAVVMDSDGEDTPAETMRLIQTCIDTDTQKIVFARRSQRTESYTFRLFYQLYRKVYRLLTGSDIRVGNFSVIPFGLLRRVVSVSEIWNHYAAGILRAKLPHVDVPTRRGHRYHGQSTMNFVALVTHGLSAISVHGESVGVRLLVASSLLIAAAIVALGVIVAIRCFTDWAIPGWSSYLAVALVSIILQTFIMSVSFIFLVLGGRNNISFLPYRDYDYFVLGLDEVEVSAPVAPHPALQRHHL